ncbi:vacuolar ATPase assembly integral membrane protein VMA21 [Hyphopichia burtonii NRRL Y-1933]|uniref:Vacuolar ATPase assembly integral membrane protein VMA21 n=1 Tax=Hyphopichia burtonii NRRL Y-1933 TaxID=984485 RepID=A0A1E4RLB7_9ASCO|nr:vacuolar ATPase assembly integral membrane protein VMA21 [Hyphopichia burtonii NRRL Y-1933]ODV68058.1 vacuolar ATPase assembly integral membrane protein VMA21 [Hyphopichia burtonii NRRL Y-1933]
MAVDIPKSVVQKLTFFTGAMVIFPVLSFFVCQWLFNNNAIISGGVAALVANIVLIGYIVAAFTEDTTKYDSEKPESKKSQ